MSGGRGSQGRMVSPVIDRDTADRLLSGRVAPDDAPPGYGDVARVLAALGGPATDAELRRLDDAVAVGIRVVAGERPTPAATARRPARRTWASRVKLVALAVLGLLVVTSGLAAAGVLPDPAQNLVSDVLSKVGIRVPRADERPAGPEDPAAGAGPAAAVPSLPRFSSAGASNATEAGEAIVPPDAPSRTVPLPPRGSGTGRADEASGGNSEDGTTIADERSGGRSSAGSENSQASHGRGHGPPADPGNGPPADRGNGPPADKGKGPPADEGNGAPPGRGNDPPPRGGGGSPHSNHP